MTPKQQKLRDMTYAQNDTGCWIWKGQVSNSGYGRIMAALEDGGTNMVSVQSASYRAFIGPVPSGYLVKQRCGQRLCINPDHLELIASG